MTRPPGVLLPTVGLTIDVRVVMSCAVVTGIVALFFGLAPGRVSVGNATGPRIASRSNLRRGRGRGWSVCRWPPPPGGWKALAGQSMSTKWLFANARPAPDFKYFSKRKAIRSVRNSMITSIPKVSTEPSTGSARHCVRSNVFRRRTSRRCSASSGYCSFG